MIKRLGILGDLHAQHTRLADALERFDREGVDAVVCTGDVADGSGCLETSCRILDDAGVICVAGNHDRWLLQNRVRHIPNAHQRSEQSEETLDYLQRLPAAESLDTVAGRLMLCHGTPGNDQAKVWPGTERMPIERSSELDTLLEDGEYRFFINGHMHYRYLIYFHGTTLLNAGTLVGDHAGYCVADFVNERVTAYAVKDASVVSEAPLSPSPEHTTWRTTREFSGSWTPITLH